MTVDALNHLSAEAHEALLTSLVSDVVLSREYVSQITSRRWPIADDVPFNRKIVLPAGVAKLERAKKRKTSAFGFEFVIVDCDLLEPVSSVDLAARAKLASSIYADFEDHLRKSALDAMKFGSGQVLAPHLESDQGSEVIEGERFWHAVIS
jgi:hypothetical protein